MSRLRPLPLGDRQTPSVLMISETGSVLWRRHRTSTYKQVTATHHHYLSSTFKHLLQHASNKLQTFADSTQQFHILQQSQARECFDSVVYKAEH